MPMARRVTDPLMRSIGPAVLIPRPMASNGRSASWPWKRLAKVGPSEVGISEAGPAEVGPMEVGPVEVGRVEIGPAEVGLLRLALRRSVPLRLASLRLIRDSFPAGAPGVPGLNALFQDAELLFVGHGCFPGVATGALSRQ